MLSREERILTDILVSRGLVARERIEACAKLTRREAGSSLVEVLVDSGDVPASEAQQAVEEARSIDASLAPDLPAGRRLGEFRILREIGRGGMGIVYEAEQEPLGRRVALKVLPAGAALDERLAIRFLREARAAGRLGHPGIVPVHTSGRAEGVLYFAMELIEGPTLAEVVSAGPLDPREAARIAAEVARALEHAHAHGLVHRDVKPENILLSADRRARITDFGLALESSGGSFTLSRHVLGTPAFIAPEQARGDSVDSRSDIYGLGAVLYAMLCGSPPHPGDVPSLVLARAITEVPRGLLSLRPELPRRLVAICERAMAREPARRYASAQEMAEELESWLAGGLADPEPESAKVAAPPARTRTAILSAVAAAAAIGGVLLLASFFAGRAPGAATELAATTPSFRPIVTPPGRKTSPTLSPDGRWLAYSSDADGDSDVYLVEVAGGEPENLTPDSPFGDLSPAFSPDGRSLAFVTTKPAAIYVLDLASRVPRKLVDGIASSLTWSSDGRVIVFSDSVYDRPGTSATSSKLFAVEVSSGHHRVLTGIDGSQPQASPKAGPVAFVSQSGGRTDIWTVPTTGGEAVRVTDDDALEWSPVWSPDGTEIYFGGDRGGTGGRLFKVAVDPGTGRPTGDPMPLAGTILPTAFYLASGRSHERALALLSLEHGGRLYRLMLSPAPRESVERALALPNRYLAATYPAVSPDGRSVAFTALTSREDLAVGGTDGAEPRLLTEDEFHDQSPSWSPDGSRIAFHSDRSGKMEIWTLRPDGSDLEQRTSMPGAATHPVWSPDGKRLAFTLEGQGAFIVPSDAIPGAGVAEPLPALENGVPFEPSSWSADGELLAGSASGIVVYSLATQQYRRLSDSGAVPVWLDHRRLLYTTAHEVRILDGRSGQSRSLVSFAPARVSSSVAVARDGRSLHVSLAVSPEEIWGTGPLRE